MIDRDILLGLVELQDLGIEDGGTLAAQVILLERPRQDELDFGDLDEVLLRCWRLLFHARVHLALAERIAADQLTTAEVQQRIGRLGKAAFEEIHQVLEQESFLFAEHDDRDVYGEFAAVFLGLNYFAPGLLESFFPALDDREEALSILAQDLDAETLFGSIEKEMRAVFGEQLPHELQPQSPSTLDLLPLTAEDPESLPAAREPSPSRYRRLMLKSQRVAQTGNAVGAAILAARAERCARRNWRAKRGPRRGGPCCGCCTAWNWPCNCPRQTLVPRRPCGRCFAADASPPLDGRSAAALRLAESVRRRRAGSVHGGPGRVGPILGTASIRRGLPSQRDVLMAKHLAAPAAAYGVRVPDEARQQLAALVNAAPAAPSSRSATTSARHRRGVPTK